MNHFLLLFLTENYRLQSKYENHLIAKVALFQFVNSFLSLFYIAFYLRDEDKLKEVSKSLISSDHILIPIFIVATGWSAHLTANHWQPTRIGYTLFCGAMETGQIELQYVGRTESHAACESQFGRGIGDRRGEAEGGGSCDATAGTAATGKQAQHWAGRDRELIV